MHEHTFNTVLQCDCAGIASPACAPQFQQDFSIDETPKFNIPAIVLDGWPNPCLQKLLDQADCFGVIIATGQTVLRGSLSIRVVEPIRNRLNNRLPRGDCFCDKAKDLRLYMCPV